MTKTQSKTGQAEQLDMDVQCPACGSLTGLNPCSSCGKQLPESTVEALYRVGQSKRGYTPGPWQLDRTGKYYNRPVLRANGWIVAILPDNSRGMVYPDRARETDEANARLIAQAPAMAEALQQLMLFVYRETPAQKAAYAQAERVLRDAGVEV